MSDWAQEQEQGLEEVQQVSEELPVSCARLIGCAGTGKSYTLLQRTQADPSYGVITATTGIAAVNVGGITINSTLRYSDLASLRDAYLTGRLARTLHPLAKEYRWLIIEEYSMAEAAALDIWYRGVQEANRYADVEEPMGILLVGDLAQLPPISRSWCFGAQHWKEFADNTHRLTTVYRQDTGPFLDALNLARLGQGGPAAEILTQAGVRWNDARQFDFPGTTILPKNEMVNKHNQMMLDTVKGRVIQVQARRWGMQRSEWGQNQRTKEWGIPQQLTLKVGALVMVLANAPDFSFVNGDCGLVEGYDPDHQCFQVRLRRTGKVMEIPVIVRSYDYSEKPDGWEGITISAREDSGEYIQRHHFRGRVRRYVTGQIEYFPLRLCYASTTHKSQSLTLDSVQIDFRDFFFSHAAMLYTALSRCRTLAGLRLVGSAEKFVKQCNMATEVLPWI